MSLNANFISANSADHDATVSHLGLRRFTIISEFEFPGERSSFNILNKILN